MNGGEEEKDNGSKNSLNDKRNVFYFFREDLYFESIAYGSLKLISYYSYLNFMRIIQINVDLKTLFLVLVLASQKLQI